MNNDEVLNSSNFEDLNTNLEKYKLTLNTAIAAETNINNDIKSNDNKIALAPPPTPSTPPTPPTTSKNNLFFKIRCL